MKNPSIQAIKKIKGTIKNRTQLWKYLKVIALLQYMANNPFLEGGPNKYSVRVVLKPKRGNEPSIDILSNALNQISKGEELNIPWNKMGYKPKAFITKTSQVKDIEAQPAGK